MIVCIQGLGKSVNFSARCGIDCWGGHNFQTSREREGEEGETVSSMGIS